MFKTWPHGDKVQGLDAQDRKEGSGLQFINFDFMAGGQDSLDLNIFLCFITFGDFFLTFSTQ